MEVILAEKCGFCAGVTNAIQMAEKVLREKGRIYSLGPIIHNNDVVARLAKMGLETVDDENNIKSGTVLIRSHGASPAQIENLKKSIMFLLFDFLRIMLVVLHGIIIVGVI